MQEEYTWHPLQECKKELDKARYACFVHPEHSSQTPAPRRGQRRRSWRDLFSLGFPATTLEVPPTVLESLKIIVNNPEEETGVGSLSVRPSYSYYPRRPDSSRKLQDRQWSDVAEVRERLSSLVDSLGVDLAKRLVYRIRE